MSEILLSQKNGSDINSRIEEWTGRKEIKDILLSLVQEKPENRPESLENVIVILERLIGNLNEYSCAVTPQVRQTGNRLSGLAGTAYASLLA